MNQIRIKTERLIIRNFNPNDLSDFILLIQDKMSSEYAPYDDQFPVDEQGIGQVFEYFRQNDGWYAVEQVQKHRMIGFVAVNTTEDEHTKNLGFTLHSNEQKKGYAYEACQALMNYYIKKCGVTSFVSGTAECNKPSVHLLTKLGFYKVSSESASFANDQNGNPIVFTAALYRYETKTQHEDTKKLNDATNVTSQNAVSVRTAVLADADAIARISEQDLGYCCTPELVKERLAAIEESREHVFTAVFNNQVIGYIHVEQYKTLYYAPMANILGVAVAAANQRMGAGRLLLQAAQEWAESIGAVAIRLNSGISRTGAHEFYRAMGYDQEKTQLRFMKQL